MTRPLQQNVPITPLAEGFEFRFYQKEDESAWAEIETSVGEFQTTDEALEYFQQNFAPYPTDVGTAITGTSTRPPTTLGRAPSIPATATITLAFSIISLLLSNL